MTIIAASWCEEGVFAFADSKRIDLLLRTELPPAEKLTQIVPWGVLATGGAGSLGDAVRTFLRSILFTFPPSKDELLAECSCAMDYMYGRYKERTKCEQSLVGCIACVPPGEQPQIWVFDSVKGLVPEPVPPEVPYWVAACDTNRAFEVLDEFWTPEVARSRRCALEWATRAVKKLAIEFEPIGFPLKAVFFDRDGKPFFARVGDNNAGPGP